MSSSRLINIDKIIQFFNYVVTLMTFLNNQLIEILLIYHMLLITYNSG